MTDYTPTTGEVMTAVVTYRAIWGPDVQPPATRAVATAEETAQYVEEWNRWRAKERAEAQVQALRMAGDDITLSWSRGMVIALATECHKKQCRCGNPAPEELARQIALAYRDQIRHEADRIAREAGIETGAVDD